MKKINLLQVSLPYLKINLLVLLFCWAGCKTTSPISTISTNKAVQTKVQELVQENSIPGLNFSVIYENGQQENYSAGWADVDKQVPLTDKHVLFSGSIGKTYAVALLMQLVEEGQVNLKSKLKDYFPEITWLSKIPNMDDITLEMLLQHTSGLPRWVMKDQIWEVLHAEPDKVWSYENRLSYIFNEPPVHEAGKGWAYSDTNYILIGMLIEKMRDSYYYDSVKSKILTPSKLTKTFPADKRRIPNLAIGYSKLPATFKIPAQVVSNGQYVFNPQMEWTGGGMTSTTSDLAQWAKIYYEGQVFSKDLVQQIIKINPNGDKVAGGHSYGMGSFIYHTKQGDAYGHSGFMPGYNSIFAYYPAQKMAVALQSNCDYATGKMKLVEYLEELLPVLLLNKS